MQSVTKLLMTVVIVLAAIAMVAAPSQAAKKKEAAKCDPLRYCSVCKGSTCELKSCGVDGKLYDNLIARTCKQPDCPAKC